MPSQYLATGQPKIYWVRGEVCELTPCIGARPTGELTVGLYRDPDEVVVEWVLPYPHVTHAWRAMRLLQHARIGDESTIAGCWFAIGLHDVSHASVIKYLADQFGSAEAFDARRQAARREFPDADQRERVISQATASGVKLIGIA